MTNTEQHPNRYRKEAECSKRCKEFDNRIKGLEDKIKVEAKLFVEKMAEVTKRLDENIACNKKFQKECEIEIEKAMKKIERSKKEVKRLKWLSAINICFFILCLIVYYVGF